ncbi:MAG: hypothetical protein A4E66_02144 [Syntrophus sp. PtaB.Bin001]|nr:MAG: hypothetical protein A4E66_02144 [Syntrophus sp. PtaB.Bin001]
MIKKISYFLITTLCVTFVACSYDLKHITLNETSDTGWTEVKKANTSGSAGITKNNLPSLPNPEILSNRSDLSEHAQKLRELKKLKDEGLLTDEEYEKKRRAIVEGL